MVLIGFNCLGLFFWKFFMRLFFMSQIRASFSIVLVFLGFASLLFFSVFSVSFPAFGGKKDTYKVLFAAQSLLERGDISYTYGGGKAGGSKICDLCQLCLSEKRPKPRTRTQACPDCASCSLDCSHFITEVFTMAGLPSSYLTTNTMLVASPKTLLKKYHFHTLSTKTKKLLAGDVLVYKGHVVLLEKPHKNALGDIIHATGGRDLKGPGHGIQRERMAHLAHFRGPLLRVLRHKNLHPKKSFFKPIR